MDFVQTCVHVKKSVFQIKYILIFHVFFVELEYRRN